MSDTITVNITSADINVNVVEAGALWGSINGTITNQTDLVNYIGNLGVTSPYKFAANNTSILPLNGTNVIAATGTNSVIAGGCKNTVSDCNSNINGGSDNTISGGYGYNTIVGGQNNTITGCFNSFIGNGFLNTSCGIAVSIVGGVCNTVSGNYSALVGGLSSIASGNFSFIGGGCSNTASGVYSAIVGGASNNTNNQACSFIIGQGITASLPNYTYVNNLSAPGSICAGTFYGDGSNLVGASLPGQADINTLVQNTSGNWNTAYNVATSYSFVSSTFATYTDVNTLTSLLVTNTTFGNYQTNVAKTTATLLPTSVYQNASGSFATNTALNAASGLLVLTTTVNTLTSLLTLTTTTRTLTSLLLPTSVYQNASGSFLTSIPQSLSGNWQSTYQTVCALSANWNNAYASTTALNLSSSLWNSVYTTVQTNSATWNTGGGSTVDTGVRALTANWQSTYVTVSSLSANWSNAYSRVSANNLYLNASTTSLSALNAYLIVQTISAATYFGVPSTGGGGSTTGAYLPLSGGQLTGFVTSTSSISAANTITGLNLAVNSQVQYLTGGTFVKVYQFYNSSTNSLDTVFN